MKIASTIFVFELKDGLKPKGGKHVHKEDWYSCVFDGHWFFMLEGFAKSNPAPKRRGHDCWTSVS
jgi:hypothetical protein